METVEKKQWYQIIGLIFKTFFKWLSKSLIFIITGILYVFSFFVRSLLFFIYLAKNIIPAGVLTVVIYLIGNFIYSYFFNKEAFLDNMFTQQRIIILVIISVGLAAMRAFELVRSISRDDYDDYMD